jgi:Fe-Mn family superoxide dismutase
MPFEAKDFKNLSGITGFSAQMLQNHFTLYQGYVTNTNKLVGILAALAKEGKAATPEFAELKRRFGWEFNGMRLHEYYFENLCKDAKPLGEKSPLFKKLVQAYGSYEAWEAEFRAIGAMRGIGWAVLCIDPPTGMPVNVWINEHDVGHLSGAVPLLVMDVFEHAYMADYGIKRADYIAQFFKSIDWVAVAKRCAGTVSK